MAPELRKSMQSHKRMREAIFAGDIFHLPATAESRALCDVARSIVMSSFSSDMPQQAQHQLSPEEFFARLTAARKSLEGERSVMQSTALLLKSLGFDPADTLLDTVRLRGVPSDGHLNPKARAAYGAHRDTWYANPQCQINFWIPIYDIEAQEGFDIYPRYFAEPVKNGSAAFDYDEWIQHGGFQSSKAGAKAVFPEAEEEISRENSWRFPMKAGDILMFSAAHLHQTHPHSSGRTRFSIDFRVVCEFDENAEIGATNVDNNSRGSCLAEYRHLAEFL